MVLAGVGGRTVAIAKENITVAEYDDWVEYVARFGNLDLRLRLEHEFARILATVLNLFSTANNVKPTDLMAHYEPPEQTLEEFVLAIGGSLRPGQK